MANLEKDMANKRWLVGFAAAAGIALAGCLPEEGASAAAAPVQSNSAPTIGGTPTTSALAGTTYAFQVTAADTDGDALIFTAVGLPAWTTLNMQTGLLQGVPAERDVGTSAAITITVSDGARSSVLPPFTITVSSAIPAPLPPPSNTAPSISATAGVAYAFQPTATDPDGDALTFTVSNRPAWVTFNPSTGRISGTPSNAHVGTTSNIVIAVSDGVLITVLPAFSITIVPAPNRAPIISGTPATGVVAGNPYSFIPAASDPDNDALSYSVAGKPTWATFSTITGALTGTPDTSAVGTYSGIVVAVTDARGTSVALPSFSINVTAPAPSGTATLTWTAPVQYTDGSQLPSDQLAGYLVYHGTSPSALSEVTMVNGAATVSHTLNQLAAGTHYFAVSAVTLTGEESGWSEVRTKTIP
jgi:hypothetical protein